MAPKPKQTKEKIAAAAAAAGKSKKKKWSKGRTRDKLDNAVFFDKATHDKLFTEIPKAKLITPSNVSEKLRISVSLAKNAIKVLESQGLIRQVGKQHGSQMIYTRNTKDIGTADEKPEVEKKGKKGKKGKAAAADVPEWD